MTLSEHTTVQFPYHWDEVIVFIFKDGSKARIFSLGFDAEFPSFKALVQEWHDYSEFFKAEEQVTTSVVANDGAE